jgi:uncharacterized protein VirK/YbjX
MGAHSLLTVAAGFCTSAVSNAARDPYNALKVLLEALRSPRAFFRWIEFLRSNKFAQVYCRRTPSFVVRPFKRYLNSNYQFPDRVRSLVCHYEFVAKRFCDAQLQSIYLGGGLILAEFPGKSGTSYRIVLVTHAPCHNEGEMALGIVTSRGELICFAIFTIGLSVDGKLQLELGNIQGQSQKTNIDATKIATRDFHGMRPKHLLMFILYSFAHHCKIDQIVCVATRAHANYLNGTNIYFFSDYDLLWEQLGGQLTGSGFYLLPSRFAYCAGVNQGRKHRGRHRRRVKLKSNIFRLLENGLTTAPNLPRGEPLPRGDPAPILVLPR